MQRGNEPCGCLGEEYHQSSRDIMDRRLVCPRTAMDPSLFPSSPPHPTFPLRFLCLHVPFHLVSFTWQVFFIGPLELSPDATSSRKPSLPPAPQFHVFPQDPPLGSLSHRKLSIRRSCPALCGPQPGVPTGRGLKAWPDHPWHTPEGAYSSFSASCGVSQGCCLGFTLHFNFSPLP